MDKLNDKIRWLREIGSSGVKDNGLVELRDKVIRFK